MALASAPKIVLGSISFTIFWILAVFPSVPFLPIGRTAGSLFGAMLAVLFRVISPEEAYASIDLQVLGLLFGTMVVSIFLEKADMFKYLANLLAYKSWGSKDLLCRVCLVSAFSSALFTNDTSCVVLTEFILKIARQHNLPPQPFLLALASSANIGSSATPIGNPQNLIIAVQSKISFGKFLFGLFPAMLVGVLVNYFILLCYFWKVLSIEKDVEIAISNTNGGNENDNDNDDSDDVSLHRFSPATMSHTSSVNSRNWSGNIHVEDSNAVNDSVSRHFWNQEKWRRLTWKICVYLVTLGMLVSFLMGLNMSWTAITAALALVVLDFKDAKPCLEKVSYSLLIFFCGMFITISGLNKTGIPSAFWDFIEPHAQIDTARGLTILALVILVLSNVASNVPTVLLLGARVAASASTISASEATKAWLILAWVSTVAGNLSLLGSAANLIVCEQARHAHYCSYNLSFWSHLRFGVPSTFIVITIGLLIVRSY